MNDYDLVDQNILYKMFGNKYGDENIAWYTGYLEHSATRTLKHLGYEAPVLERKRISGTFDWLLRMFAPQHWEDVPDAGYDDFDVFSEAAVLLVRAEPIVHLGTIFPASRRPIHDLVEQDPNQTIFILHTYYLAAYVAARRTTNSFRIEQMTEEKAVEIAPIVRELLLRKTAAYDLARMYRAFTGLSPDRLT